jgi:hypothetical protein
MAAFEFYVDGVKIAGSGDMLKSTFNANTILKADTDNTPEALTIAEQRIVGRITSGEITGLTATQIRTLINVENGAEANVVDSVNTATGAVVLDSDDISDTAKTNKFVTATDITNLGNLSGTNTGDNTVCTSGTATTAATLATARTIGGVSFDGSANITVATATSDFAVTGALTATSYGGITQANLVDKSATETISGQWDFEKTLLVRAGTATAGTAPIKLTTGTLLGTPEAGAIEYDGCSVYITNVATQRSIDRTSDVAVSTVTVANTTVETTLWTGSMPANSLCVGNVFKFHADGIIQNDGPAATEEVTLRIKVGGATVATLNPTTRSIGAGSHWHVDANATQRTLGESGSRAIHIDVNIDDVTKALTATATINTTINMDVTVTAQWASADVNNTISLYQAYMEYKN